MNPRQTLILARKELLEILRDRRTLVSLLLVPVVLYPGLILLITQVAGQQVAALEREASRVEWVGDVGESALPEALRSGDEILLTLSSSREGSLERLLRGDCDAVVESAEGFSAQIESLGTGHLTVHTDPTSEASRQGTDRVEEALAQWKATRVSQRLRELKVPPESIQPLEWKIQNVSAPERMGGYLLGQIVPLLLILSIVLGAFYPAVDLTAGEKERRTLQTLLVAPVSSTTIIAGKYLAVLLVTVLSGTLNIGSVALFFGNAGGFETLGADIAVSMSLSTLIPLFLATLALASFYAAVLMAVATLARNFKEAQTYLTPVTLACVIPAVFVQIPGIHLSGTTVAVPGLNIALIVEKLLLSGELDVLGVTGILVTLGYALLSLGVAARIFQNENVMMGHSEPVFSGKKSVVQDRPQWGDTLVLYGILFALVVFGDLFLGEFELSARIFLTPLLLILLPTLLFAQWRGWLTREGFHWKKASVPVLSGAALIGLSAWTLVLPLTAWISDWIGPIPEELIQMAESLLAPPGDGFYAFLLMVGITLNAGFCEETFFRGPLLHAFRTRFGGTIAVFASAILFAMLHLSIHRFAGTFVLGLCAGGLALRSQSVWPAVVFHVCNNAVVFFFSESGDDTALETLNWEWTLWGSALFIGGCLVFIRSSRVGVFATPNPD